MDIGWLVYGGFTVNYLPGFLLRLGKLVKQLVPAVIFKDICLQVWQPVLLSYFL